MSIMELSTRLKKQKKVACFDAVEDKFSFMGLLVGRWTSE